MTQHAMLIISETIHHRPKCWNSWSLFWAGCSICKTLAVRHTLWTKTRWWPQRGSRQPTANLETARRLGVAPETCVCLEDSPNGVLSGHRAGMLVINVPDPRYSLTAAQAVYADLVLESLAEFTAVTLRQLENLRIKK